MTKSSSNPGCGEDSRGGRKESVWSNGSRGSPYILLGVLQYAKLCRLWIALSWKLDAAGEEESDEEDEDFVAEKDDEGSPTETSYPKHRNDLTRKYVSDTDGKLPQVRFLTPSGLIGALDVLYPTIETLQRSPDTADGRDVNGDVDDGNFSFYGTQSAVFMQPSASSLCCYLKRAPETNPPLCSSDIDPDVSWNVQMNACITPYSTKMHKGKSSGLQPWPSRLSVPPPRLDEIGISHDQFQEDTNTWIQRVSEFWKQMRSVIKKDSIRNVMDMNSNLGGFAAALKDKDVWVMNVAPVNASSKLKIIYDRGLIGTVHDQCESFSTYPRTYDLLHAWSVFSEIEERGCSVEDLLIEMDRMLRPAGFGIIRDKSTIVDYIRKFLTALRWDGYSLEVEPKTDALSLSNERVVIARKQLWGDDDEEEAARF
ncbi:hypothetical protein M8C21_006855 [Ambrosia artemisiifolia]|uniref:Methyltransferase n=1 Tax=Ambrosia artemisiifolia TaxID=4212 RepID=A0AAD5GEW5_AMBAR|nr:hypothetical protein M8C21_006855 [Ambrosia artemisiifolia]